jgi:hypothetical protein
MDLKRYMKPLRVVGYIICGLFLSFGAIAAAIIFLTENSPEF